MSYDIRCEECKETVGTTTNVIESYQGITCAACRERIASEIAARKRGARKAR